MLSSADPVSAVNYQNIPASISLPDCQNMYYPSSRRASLVESSHSRRQLAPSRRCNQQADALDQLLCLAPPVGTPHHNAMRLAVVAHQVTGDAIDLQRQLACWGDDQGASAVARHELGAIQQLGAWDQERQRFARACGPSQQRQHGRHCVPVCNDEHT